jgi:hypothetical protein
MTMEEEHTPLEWLWEGFFSTHSVLDTTVDQLNYHGRNLNWREQDEALVEECDASLLLCPRKAVRTTAHIQMACDRQ